MDQIKFPSDIDLERSVLCQIMVDPVEAWEYLDALTVEDFYSGTHQIIFEQIKLIAEPGRPIGAVEITSALSVRKLLEKVGGATYFSKILDEVTPCGSDFAIRSLRRLSCRRQAIQLCNAVYKRAMADDDVEGMVDYLQSGMMRLDPESSTKASILTLHDGLAAGLERWKEAAAHPGNITGVPCGMRQIDFMTCGFQPSDLVILAARPSMGKTALSIGWTMSAANNGFAALYFSLEQSSSQLITRAVAAKTLINSHKFKTGYFSPGDIDRVARAAHELSPLPVYLDDTGGLSVEDICRRAKRFCRTKKIGVIFVDHLQLIGSKSRSENRNIELGTYTRALKTLAKDLNIPVVALSQLNRQLETRPDKRPRLSDLRESGNIEQDADIVASIYRPEVYGITSDKNFFEGYTEIALLKQRDGPTGVAVAKFNPKAVRFFDVELRNEQGLFYQKGEKAPGQKEVRR